MESRGRRKKIESSEKEKGEQGRAIVSGQLRGLWVVAAMYNAVELPFCALVLRPRSLDCRWVDSGAVIDPYEVKRYYGHKRFKVVTESVAYAEGIRKVKEQAGVLGL